MVQYSFSKFSKIWRSKIDLKIEIIQFNIFGTFKLKKLAYLN